MVAVVLAAAWRGWLWRLDLVLYDAQLALWRTVPPDDVVLVVIDEESLDRIGRWPWPRARHAELLDRLREAGVRAVALDLIFAEPDALDPDGDRRLAEALEEFPGAVLPVLVEQRAGGTLVERLPLPSLAVTADGLGHVHVELDADGIVRSQFLREGLGDPHWPALALALLEQVSGRPLDPMPGERAPERSAGPAPVLGRWLRDYRVLVPFGGPAGHFQRLSYAQVLNAEFLPGSLRGRIVLVGVTATGLGDTLPTPVSGQRRPMPGVEFNAHVLQALRTGTAITPLPLGWQMLLGGALTLLPLLCYPRLRPRQALLAAVAGTLAAPLLALLLLFASQLWFPPAAAMLGVLLGYPLWSWRRLEGAVRYFERELALVQHETAERSRLTTLSGPRQALSFVCAVTGLGGWRLMEAGRTLAEEGAAPAAPSHTPGMRFEVDGDGLWARVYSDEGERWLGVAWPPPGDHAQTVELLGAVADRCRAVVREAGGDVVELVESRIAALQEAAADLRASRALLDGGLAHMQDGLLLADCAGNVLLANPGAAHALDLVAGDLPHRSLLDILQRLTPLHEGDWREHLATVLLRRATWRQPARDGAERELLVSGAPLSDSDATLLGVVVTLTDVSALRESERQRAELLGFLSHDLRAPLHSVLALVDLAQGDDNPGAQRRTLTRIEAATRDTLSLADQFLDLTRAESGTLTRRADVDLVGVVLDARDQVWAQAEAAGVALRTEFECDEALLLGDTRLLVRALVNLLGNAVKWSPQGGEVVVSLEDVGELFRLQVRDRGPGIDPDDQQRLFQRFSRARALDGRERGGIGLGLTLVKAVAEAHGGSVSVHSTPGAGACFEMCLPHLATPAEGAH